MIPSDLMRPVMQPLLAPLVFALALAALSCHRDGSQPPAAVGPQKRPQTQSECSTCNGSWGVHGLGDVASCICRTHDAGKTCKDGLDCEGECEVVEGKVEVTQPGPPPRGFFVGKCTEFDIVFGCRKLLMDGVAAHGPAALDEPIAETCID